MNIGKMRPARLGEVPTHYAIEDIKAGEPVIDMRYVEFARGMDEMATALALKYPPRRAPAFSPRVGADLAREGAEHTIVIGRGVVRVHGRPRPRSEFAHNDLTDAMRFAMDSRLLPGRRMEPEKKSLGERVLFWLIMILGGAFLGFCMYRLGDALAYYVNSL